MAMRAGSCQAAAAHGAAVDARRHGAGVARHAVRPRAGRHRAGARRAPGTCADCAVSHRARQRRRDRRAAQRARPAAAGAGPRQRAARPAPAAGRAAGGPAPAGQLRHGARRGARPGGRLHAGGARRGAAAGRRHAGGERTGSGSAQRLAPAGAGTDPRDHEFAHARGVAVAHRVRPARRRGRCAAGRRPRRPGNGAGRHRPPRRQPGGIRGQLPQPVHGAACAAAARGARWTVCAAGRAGGAAVAGTRRQRDVFGGAGVADGGDRSRPAGTGADQPAQERGGSAGGQPGSAGAGDGAPEPGRAAAHRSGRPWPRRAAGAGRAYFYAVLFDQKTGTRHRTGHGAPPGARQRRHGAPRAPGGRRRALPAHLLGAVTAPCRRAGCRLRPRRTSRGGESRQTPAIATRSYAFRFMWVEMPIVCEKAGALKGAGLGSLTYRLRLNDGQGDVDVATGGVRVRAHDVGGVDQFLGGLAVHAWQRNFQFHFDAETGRDRADAHGAFDRDVGRHGDLVAATHEFHRAQEAGRVTGSKQLLGVGAGGAGATEFFWRGQLDVQHVIRRDGFAFTAAGGGCSSAVFGAVVGCFGLVPRCVPRPAVTPASQAAIARCTPTRSPTAPSATATVLCCGPEKIDRHRLSRWAGRACDRLSQRHQTGRYYYERDRQPPPARPEHPADNRDCRRHLAHHRADGVDRWQHRHHRHQAHRGRHPGRAGPHGSRHDRRQHGHPLPRGAPAGRTHRPRLRQRQRRRRTARPARTGADVRPPVCMDRPGRRQRHRAGQHRRHARRRGRVQAALVHRRRPGRVRARRARRQAAGQAPAARSRQSAALCRPGVSGARGGRRRFRRAGRAPELGLDRPAGPHVQRTRGRPPGGHHDAVRRRHGADGARRRGGHQARTAGAGRAADGARHVRGAGARRSPRRTAMGGRQALYHGPLRHPRQRRLPGHGLDRAGAPGRRQRLRARGQHAAPHLPDRHRAHAGVRAVRLAAGAAADGAVAGRRRSGAPHRACTRHHAVAHRGAGGHAGGQVAQRGSRAHHARRADRAGTGARGRPRAAVHHPRCDRRGRGGLRRRRHAHAVQPHEPRSARHGPRRRARARLGAALLAVPPGRQDAAAARRSAAAARAGRHDGAERRHRRARRWRRTARDAVFRAPAGGGRRPRAGRRGGDAGRHAGAGGAAQAARQRKVFAHHRQQQPGADRVRGPPARVPLRQQRPPAHPGPGAGRHDRAPHGRGAGRGRVRRAARAHRARARWRQRALRAGLRPSRLAAALHDRFYSRRRWRRPRARLPHPGHRYLAAQADRDRPGGQRKAGGSGQPRQERVRGQHEPRDPHPDERGAGRLSPAGQHAAVGRAARLPGADRIVRALAAAHHQRHPRLFQDRGGQDPDRARGLRHSRADRGGGNHHAVVGQQAGRGTDHRCAGRFPGAHRGRRHAHPPDHHQPGQQRPQVHGGRRGGGVPGAARHRAGNRRARHRHRHDAGAAAAPVPAVRTGRYVHVAQVRRHGPGPDDFAQAGGADGRRHHRGQRGRRRLRVYGDDPRRAAGGTAGRRRRRRTAGAGRPGHAAVHGRSPAVAQGAAAPRGLPGAARGQRQHARRRAGAAARARGHRRGVHQRRSVSGRAAAGTGRRAPGGRAPGCPPGADARGAGTVVRRRHVRGGHHAPRHAPLAAAGAGAAGRAGRRCAGRAGPGGATAGGTAPAAGGRQSDQPAGGLAPAGTGRRHAGRGRKRPRRAGAAGHVAGAVRHHFDGRADAGDGWLRSHAHPARARRRHADPGHERGRDAGGAGRVPGSGHERFHFQAGGCGRDGGHHRAVAKHLARRQDHLERGLARHGGLGQLDAAHAGHDHIAEQQGDVGMAAQRVERLLAVVGGQHLVAQAVEQMGGHVQHVGLVVHDQHFFGRIGSRHLFLVRGRRGREAQRDAGAGAHGGRDGQVAARLLHQPVHLRQAQARTLAHFLGGEKRFHRALHHLLRHAGARVGDGHGHVVARHRGGQRDDAAAVDGVARVHHQVQQRRLELRQVRHHVGHVGGQAHLEPDRAADGAPQHRLEAVDGAVDVDPLRLDGLLARKRQQLLGEAGAALGGALHAVDGPVLHLAVVDHAQQVEAIGDHVEQVVEIMGDAARELADRFELLRLEQRFLGLRQRVLGQPALGDVARDLGKADQGAVRVVHRVDHHAGPEAGAVLAHAPAFVLEAALRRLRQHLRRAAGCAVFGRIKAGKMLADDFRLRIPLEALRARVPAADDAVGRQHVDGVVAHARDEQLELFSLGGDREWQGGRHECRGHVGPFAAAAPGSHAEKGLVPAALVRRHHGRHDFDPDRPDRCHPVVPRRAARPAQPRRAPHRGAGCARAGAAADRRCRPGIASRRPHRQHHRLFRAGHHGPRGAGRAEGRAARRSHLPQSVRRQPAARAALRRRVRLGRLAAPPPAAAARRRPHRAGHPGPVPAGPVPERTVPALAAPRGRLARLAQVGPAPERPLVPVGPALGGRHLDAGGVSDFYLDRHLLEFRRGCTRLAHGVPAPARARHRAAAGDLDGAGRAARARARAHVDQPADGRHRQKRAVCRHDAGRQGAVVDLCAARGQLLRPAGPGDHVHRQPGAARLCHHGLAVVPEPAQAAAHRRRRTQAVRGEFLAGRREVDGCGGPGADGIRQPDRRRRAAGAAKRGGAAGGRRGRARALAGKTDAAPAGAVPARAVRRQQFRRRRTARRRPPLQPPAAHGRRRAQAPAVRGAGAGRPQLRTILRLRPRARCTAAHPGRAAAASAHRSRQRRRRRAGAVVAHAARRDRRRRGRHGRCDRRRWCGDHARPGAVGHGGGHRLHGLARAALRAAQPGQRRRAAAAGAPGPSCRWPGPGLGLAHHASAGGRRSAAAAGGQSGVRQLPGRAAVDLHRQRLGPGRPAFAPARARGGGGAPQLADLRRAPARVRQHLRAGNRRLARRRHAAGTGPGVLARRRRRRVRAGPHARARRCAARLAARRRRAVRVRQPAGHGGWRGCGAGRDDRPRGDERGRQVQVREPLADFQVVGALQGKARQRVACERVHAQRHHQRIGAKAAQADARRFQRGKPGVSRAALGQRQVHIESQSGAVAPFVGVAQIKRVLAARVGVDRDEQHVAAVVENALGAVAVVVVEVEDGHLAGAVVEQVLGGQRGVIEKTVTAEKILARVVAGRTTEDKRAALAQAQRVGGVDGAVGARLGGDPGAGRERRAAVHRVQAHPGRKIIGFDIVAQRAHRPHRGQRVPARVGGVEREPVAPGGAQEVQKVSTRPSRGGSVAAGAGVAQVAVAVGGHVLVETGARRRFHLGLLGQRRGGHGVERGRFVGRGRRAAEVGGVLGALRQAERGKRIAVFAQRVQHLGRRRQAGVGQLRALRRQRVGVGGVAAQAVEQRGDRADAFEQFRAPLLQADGAVVVLEHQARTAAFLDGAGKVGRVALAFLRRDGRAVLERAEQQEGVQQAAGLHADAHRLERVHVHAAHLDVLHAARAQRLDRPLAGLDHALGADGGVVLVFDLQHVGAELDPFAVALGTELGIRSVRLVDGARQGRHIAVEAILVRTQAGLGVVLIAEVAHAQAGGVRQVQGVVRQLVELVRAAAQETGRQRRRRAEQVHQQPAVAAEVADGGQVRFRLVRLGAQLFFALRVARCALGVVLGQHAPQALVERIVVMDARDALHGLAIAQRQAAPVDVLEHAQVGGAVPGNLDILLGRQVARHRLAPQQFIAQLGVGIAVNAVQAGNRGGNVGLRGGDEFKQGFCVIGGDLRVGERGAQGHRVAGARQLAAGVDAQGFAFDAAQAATEHGASLFWC
uniref:Uncharacterized protein n=1 Tax=Tanacetum cinerariifolium TaxID=118510 RepID=A0A699GHR2_TANCI|nr:hypothetical protein [Tanacetum cinerariifolium]